jgi:Mg2+ and Co2+ transporter CorA
MSEPDYELIQRRQLAQHQLADAAAQVGRLTLQISGYQEAFLHQNDQVQALIHGTETGADHTIARHLGDASSSIQQAVQSLMAAEATCRSASRA